MATLTLYNLSNAATAPGGRAPQGRVFVEDMAMFLDEGIGIDLEGQVAFAGGGYELGLYGTFTIDPLRPDVPVVGTVTELDIVSYLTAEIGMEVTGVAAPVDALIEAMFDLDQVRFADLLFAGNDLMDATRVTGRSVSLWGNAGADTLLGGASFNSLHGEAGDDRVVGGNAFAGQSLAFGVTGDSLTGGLGADTLFGLSGNDTLRGDEGDDSLSGGGDADSLDGGAGLDRLAGGDANDTMLGGTSADTLLGEAGNDLLRGEEGRDLLEGGLGNDVIHGNDDRDTLSGGDGNDLLYGELSTSVLIGADSLSGDAGADTMYGYGGNDSLRGGDGNDRLYGGAGNDFIEGGAGRDTMVGGGGADLFVFRSTTHSTTSQSDLILGFRAAQGDKIDLSLIDASRLVGGNQAFTFIGNAAFTAGVAGQARTGADSLEGAVRLLLDTNGDQIADAAIIVDVSLSGGALSASDFIL